MSSEPKVTECCAGISNKGTPIYHGLIDIVSHHNAILIFKEDYDRLLEAYRMLLDVMDDEHSWDENLVSMEIEERLKEAKNG